MVRISIILEDWQWVGGLAMDLQISTYVHMYMGNGLAYLYCLALDLWIRYGLVDWVWICDCTTLITQTLISDQ